MPRGRPKGSKNKSKIIENEKAVPLDIREVKRQIRMLRKIKKDTHKGSEERHDLCRKIRELRSQLLPIYSEVSKTKSELIEKIMNKRPEYKILNIDLRKYTEEQLQKHFLNIEHKGRLING
jgi:hypothetical protein